jgi:hypothetical protein
VNGKDFLERARRVVLDDPWRRGAALLLAIGIWLVALRNTTEDEERIFRVEAIPSSGEPILPRPGTLGIRVRTDMRRISAPLVTVHLRGPRREFEGLEEIRGIYDPGPSFEGGQVSFGEESIEWRPARVRDLVRKIDPSRVEVVFGKIERREVPLDPKVLLVEGKPAEGFTAHPERARFYPSRVVVLGLRGDLALLDGPEGFRLAPIELDGNTTSAVVRVGLHPDLEAAGLELDPRTAPVEVEVPVEPTPTEVRFRAHVAAIFTDVTRANSRPPFVLAEADREREFILSYRGPSPLPAPGAEGAALLVQFTVDLAEISPEDLAEAEEVELPLRWYPRLPAGERPSTPIQIRPADERSMTARVVRKPPE